MNSTIDPLVNPPRIHIAFGFVQGPYGGGNQFLKALRAEFLEGGIYADEIEDADAIIINSFHRGQEEVLKDVLRVKRSKPGVFVFHRVDGPYSLVRGRSDYADHAVNELNRLLADATIFQSGWSRTECLRQGLVARYPETIISNAPAAGLFCPVQKKLTDRPKVRLVATSWSANSNKGFDTYLWMDKNLDWSRYEMTIFGNSPVPFSNINLVPPLSTAELAKKLPHFDIFVSAARNEPCSNSLIEALHSGLPAVVFNGGGSPDLVGGAGLAFSTAKEIPACLEELVINYDKFRARITAPDIREIASQYVLFIRSVLGQARPRSVRNVALSIFSWKFLSKFARFKWGLWARLPEPLKFRLMGRAPSLSRTIRW